MMYILFTILFCAGFIAGWIVLWLLINHRETDLELSHDIETERSAHKEENKDKIIVMLNNAEEITNNDVEYLLGVSNTTAWRYLEELEEEGVIKQMGKGRAIHYVRT